jgi:hypothetical protein
MERNRLALIAGLCGLVAGTALTAAAFSAESLRAQEGTEGRQICDYTYINDSMRPEIGQNGAIKYNDAWKAVVEGGWKLKTASDEMYVFERCR